MFNNKSFLWLALSAALIIGGCSSDKKPPLKGERISVLQMQNTLAVDEKAQSVDIALPEAIDNTAWPQASGNAVHAPQHVVLNEKLERAWSEDIGEGSEDDRKLITSPIVADGKVFVANTEGHVLAYDAQSGKRLWRVSVISEDEDAGVVSAGLAFGNGTLYATDGIGNLLALNPKDGSKLWHYALGQAVRGSPTVYGTAVYVVTLSDETIALNASNGDLLWRHQGMQESAGLLGTPSPAAEGSVVISSYSSGDVVALRAETGQEAWSDNLTGIAEFQSRAVTTLAGFRGNPVLDQDDVIVGNASTRLAMINLPSGERKWQKEFGVVSTPWVAGNMVYVLSSQSELVALIKQTGQVRWTIPLPRYEDPTDKEDLIFWNGPLLASNTLYIVGSNDQMLAVDPLTGKTKQTYKLPGKVMTAPIVANKTLYFVTDKGVLVAYR